MEESFQMDLKLLTLDAQLASLEDDETAAEEIDGIVGALSPANRFGRIGSELDEDAFDASILAAYISAH
jgi:hypothetical protein